MTTLHMKTEEVRNAAHQLDLAVGDLYLKPGKLKSAASSLRSAWQGGKSTYYANQLKQMGTLLHDEVINLQRLVKRLYGEVDEWEDADSTHDFGSSGASTSIWDLSQRFRETIDSAKTKIELGVTLGVIAGMVPGATYAGQVIFHGGQRLKDFIGLAPNLTHIKATNLPRHLKTQNSLLGKFEVGMAIWETVEKGTQDWAHYDKTSEKIAAVGIDAAFVGAKTLVQHHAGHLAAGVAVTFLATTVGAPAVVVAGGGLLAWWVGSTVAEIAANKLEVWAETSGAKEAAVKTAGAFLESAGKGIQETGKAVDRAFKNVISNFW